MSDPVETKIAWTVGLDIGQVGDPSVLVASENLWRPGEDDPEHRVRAVEVFPLGEYRDLVDRLGKFRDRHPSLGERSVPWAVDATGVGRAVFEMVADGLPGANLVHVSITSGENQRQDPDTKEWKVPKLDLIARVQAALENRRVRIGRGSPGTDLLLSEMKAFEMKTSGSGRTSFSAPSGAHDDTVIALALSIWAARFAIPRRYSAKEIRHEKRDSERFRRTTGKWRRTRESETDRLRRLGRIR